jgi:hypothetical protein
MNTGMGDAENLAWKLALVVSGADPRLLDTYEAERRPIAKGVLKTTSSITEVVVGQRRASRLLRDRIAVPLMNQRWVQNLITERASQLKVSYRHGPLGARRHASFLECERVTASPIGPALASTVLPCGCTTSWVRRGLCSGQSHWRMPHASGWAMWWPCAANGTRCWCDRTAIWHGAATTLPDCRRGWTMPSARASEC